MGQQQQQFQNKVTAVAAMRGDLRVRVPCWLHTSITAWAFFARADAPPKIVQRLRTILTRIFMICILNRDFGLQRESRAASLFGGQAMGAACVYDKKAALSVCLCSLGFIGVLMHTTHITAGCDARKKSKLNYHSRSRCRRRYARVA
jgi:hypothetical protein